MTDSKKQVLKTIRRRNYLNRDFDDFKGSLFEYARTYFPDKIKDFSETSLGGLFLEMAAYVGDVQSFYMDHLFHELSPETAVEASNIQKLLRESGVKIIGASPAVVDVTFVVVIPVATGLFTPDLTALPIIYAGTIVESSTGITFELTENLDFAEKDSNGNYKATILIHDRDTNNNPISYFFTRTGLCVSGQRASEDLFMSSFEAFKQFTLTNSNVSSILDVIDSEGNQYYEVEHLTQDTVFKGILNRNDDAELVKENLEIIPAPYRFVAKTDISTNLTTLTFGGGSAETTTDDIVPDPSEYAVPLYGKQTFSRFSIDPSSLLQTSTLGVITPNSTITVTYRYGGGLSHNIQERTISGVKTLSIGFLNGPITEVSAFVRASIDAYNEEAAGGGLDAPTIDELKTYIAAARNSQSRITTKEDLLARIYMMPSEFGRVFRAAIRSNPNNPQATRLFILSKDINGNLAVSPDALKKNLSTYLNQYRLISDAIDILDASVINIRIKYIIVAEPDVNKQLVLQNINSRLKDYFNIKNFEIEQPIVLSDIQNIIFNNNGVVSVQEIKVENISGTVGSRVYSDITYDIISNTSRGIIFAPIGGMFELRTPDENILGNCY